MFLFGSLYFDLNSKGFRPCSARGLGELRYRLWWWWWGTEASEDSDREGDGRIKDRIVLSSLKENGEGAKWRRYYVSSDVESILVIGHQGYSQWWRWKKKGKQQRLSKSRFQNKYFQ